MLLIVIIIIIIIIIIIQIVAGMNEVTLQSFLTQ